MPMVQRHSATLERQPCSADTYYATRPAISPAKLFLEERLADPAGASGAFLGGADVSFQDK